VPELSPDLRALNPASKEYLEAVYELEEEGQRIYQARIGERLGLAPATVSEGMRRLVTEGYVEISGARDIVLIELPLGSWFDWWSY
jgi:Mn-dependent DtxR family transcriptional regulator